MTLNDEEILSAVLSNHARWNTACAMERCGAGVMTPSSEKLLDQGVSVSMAWGIMSGWDGCDWRRSLSFDTKVNDSEFLRGRAIGAEARQLVREVEGW